MSRTKQETFNTVYTQITAQGERSHEDKCKYLSKNGNKCAIGTLIDDPQIANEWNSLEHYGISS